jgi:two-component system, OmpR family, osmolarity sensor histidine kinase EnvZ
MALDTDKPQQKPARAAGDGSVRPAKGRADRRGVPLQNALRAAEQRGGLRLKARLRLLLRTLAAPFLWLARAIAQLLSSTIGRRFTEMLPKGLYGRALMIVIVPILLLQGVMAFTFMERHFNQVTRKLAETMGRNIAAVVDLYEGFGFDSDESRLVDLAQTRLGLTTLQILPPGDLPLPQARPFWALVERTLSEELRKEVQRPFWVDTVGQSSHVEIRVKLDTAVLRFVTPRNQIAASNSHIFLVWMVGTSTLLLGAAILLLRNQIKPILTLAQAANAFGKGRGMPSDFKPRGAREVREAAQAFLVMGDRITQHVDQRTTMLAGVSHDLRTVLTRFKLELALLPEGPELEALRSDVDDMQQMLEDYLAFARGDGGEAAQPTNVQDLVTSVYEDVRRLGPDVRLDLSQSGDALDLPLKRQACKRALINLVTNAARYGENVTITLERDEDSFSVRVDDDGEGIPEGERENVFKPFYRLDKARTHSSSNSGLGLAIARDIARGQGGDIVLGTSHLGGLRASMRLPI